MTRRPLGRTPASVALVCAVALLSLLALASTASATEYCVGPADAAECPATAVHPAGDPGSVAQLQNAIAAASNNDRVYVYSGTFLATGSGFNFSGNNLEVRGVGPTKPVFTVANGSAANTARVVGNSLGVLAKFTNIAIEMPSDAESATGLYVPAGGARVDGVTITTRGGQNERGVVIGGSNSDLLNSNITLPTAGSTGIDVLGGATTTKLVGVDVTAATGIKANDSYELRIHRAKIRAVRGLDLTDSNGTTIASSLFQPAASGTGSYNAVRLENTSGTANQANVFNCTVIGRGETGDVAFLASASGTDSVSTINVDSTLTIAYDAVEAEIGDSYVNVDFSPSFDSVDQVAFNNAAGGDFSLQRSSALVDAGNPSALPNESSTDLAGNTRIVSRGAGNRRDIGAYEVQNAAPVARIKVVTAVPSTTAPVAFSATDSTDADGDAMTYSWRFDSVAFANGPEVSRSFPLIGPHTVELTATDSTGVASTVTSQFEVAKGFLPLTLRSRNVRSDKRGRFSITMTCPDRATSNCTGRMIFETVKKIEAKNYQDPPKRTRSSKRKILRAANYVFSIEPGTTRKLTIQTYGTFQNVLKKHKKFKLVAKVVSGSTNNASLVANRPTFMLSAPNRR